MIELNDSNAKNLELEVVETGKRGYVHLRDKADGKFLRNVLMGDDGKSVTISYGTCKRLTLTIMLDDTLIDPDLSV